MRLLLAVLLCVFSVGCGPFKKDNEPKGPINPASERLVQREAKYKDLNGSFFDEYGFLVLGNSIGDSALFTCLSVVAGSTKIDIADLFTAEGKPLRHPKISRNSSKTPISKDMVNGILWCLYEEGRSGNRAKAREWVGKMIEYGRSNLHAGLWNYCSDQDVRDYGISTEDLLGRCVMTPAASKDIYRVAIYLGWDCDSRCKVTMQTGVNIPSDSGDFGRHLSTLTTMRNGILEEGINDNSLNLLKKFAQDQPRNALYQAAYAMFKDGDQSKAYEALDDETLFPLDRLPSGANYCTEYLFQRDEIRDEELAVSGGCISYYHPDSKQLVQECGIKDPNGNPAGDGYKVSKRVYNDDWLPCSEGSHPGVDWLFAYKVATGGLK